MTKLCITLLYQSCTKAGLTLELERIDKCTSNKGTGYKPQLLFNTSLLSKYMYTANICVSVLHDVDVK